MRNKYAGTVYDALSGLNYMQARYQNSSRGQFVSQDPLFLGIPTQQNLTNPQSLNSYSYTEGNPISRSDPTGLWYKEFVTGQQPWPSFQLELGQAAGQLSKDSLAWNFAFNHPYATGAMTGLISGAAVISGVDALAAFKAAGTAGYAGASASYVAKQLFAGAVYSTLTAGTLNSIPGSLQTLSQANLTQPSSITPTVVSVSFNVGPTYIGGYTGAISDTVQFLSLVSQGVKLLMNNSASSQRQTTSSSPTNARSISGGSSSAAPQSSSSGGQTWGSVLGGFNPFQPH